MPQTHFSLHYHIVFSTKERRPIIADEWRGRLHAYLGGCVKTAGGVPEAIGGTRDHIHLLIGLRATHCLADVMRDIKANSSAWVKSEFNQRFFGWQDGYGAFTVSHSNIEAVREYVLNQDEHHDTRTFQDEYLLLLRKHETTYDERYLW